MNYINDFFINPKNLIFTYNSAFIIYREHVNLFEFIIWSLSFQSLPHVPFNCNNMSTSYFLISLSFCRVFPVTRYYQLPYTFPILIQKNFFLSFSIKLNILQKGFIQKDQNPCHQELLRSSFVSTSQLGQQWWRKENLLLVKQQLLDRPTRPTLQLRSLILMLGRAFAKKPSQKGFNECIDLIQNIKFFVHGRDTFIVFE